METKWIVGICLSAFVLADNIGTLHYYASCMYGSILLAVMVFVASMFILWKQVEKSRQFTTGILSDISTVSYFKTILIISHLPHICLRLTSFVIYFADDFEPAEKRVLMETLAVEYGAGLDTLRRTIQRNRVKSIPSLVMGNIDTSKYRCVTDGEHLLLKDDDNMILVAIYGRVKQIPKEVQGTGSSQLYTVIVEANGGYWLPIFFVFIRDAKRTTHENVFGFLGKLIKPLRGQAPLIPHDVKLITDFEIQAIDAIKSTLGVEVLGYEMKCHFHYAQCINCRANALHFGKVLKESATVGIFFRRLQMLPFMPPHLVGLSSVLEPPRIPNDFTSRLEHLTLTGTPSLDEMLKFCAAKLTMAKTLATSFGNGSLKDRYIRPDDKARQRNISDIMANFQQHIVQLDTTDRFSTRRELKQYLDDLATNLAS
uniref:MULE domain-containing protein n=1 Tax=Heterorhabditis bacteriophora TaxID=37862 RepID=A0A1I7WKA7_HETBA